MSTKKKKPAAAPAAPTAPAAPAAATFSPGDKVQFHQPLAAWSRDEYEHLAKSAKARGEKMPARGSFAPRQAEIAAGPSSKGQYLLRMLDNQEEQVTSPGVGAGQFSA